MARLITLLAAAAVASAAPSPLGKRIELAVSLPGSAVVFDDAHEGPLVSRMRLAGDKMTYVDVRPNKNVLFAFFFFHSAFAIFIHYILYSLFNERRLPEA